MVSIVWRYKKGERDTDQSDSLPQNAWSYIATDDQNNQPPRDNDVTHDNTENTLAANVSGVNANANTVAFKDDKQMFSAFEKKSKEQNKLMDSLAKQIETRTANL